VLSPTSIPINEIIIHAIEFVVHKTNKDLADNIMRIEESPPIWNYLKKNKEPRVRCDRGFLQYDVQRHRVQRGQLLL